MRLESRAHNAEAPWPKDMDPNGRPQHLDDDTEDRERAVWKDRISWILWSYILWSGAEYSIFVALRHAV